MGEAHADFSADSAASSANGSSSNLPAVSETLDDHVRKALESSLAENTRRGYRAQVAIFSSWCTANGLKSLPASPTTVARFLSARAQAGASISTLRGGRAAIGALHRTAGEETDPTRSELVRRTLEGLGRSHRRPLRQAEPLTLDGLDAILRTADRPRPRGKGMESAELAARRGAIDKAVAALLFMSGLRRSEVEALVWRDVRKGKGRGTLLVKVEKSKTDQRGEKEDLRLLKGAAAKAVDALRPEVPDPEAPVIGLAGSSISRRLAAAAKAAGLDGRFSGHSGRRGLATELSRRGAAINEIMDAGNWRTPGMVIRYAKASQVEDGAVARHL